MGRGAWGHLRSFQANGSRRLPVAGLSMLQVRTFTASTAPIQFSLSKPFTRSSLNFIRSRLAKVYSEGAYNHSETNAAVLVPFCNVNNKPGILLEVRGKLRTHSGEVRYASIHPRTRQRVYVATSASQAEKLTK